MNIRNHIEVHTKNAADYGGGVMFSQFMRIVFKHRNTYFLCLFPLGHHRWIDLQYFFGTACAKEVGQDGQVFRWFHTACFR